MKILKDSNNKKSVKCQNQNIKYDEDKYKKIKSGNLKLVIYLIKNNQ